MELDLRACASGAFLPVEKLVELNSLSKMTLSKEPPPGSRVSRFCRLNP
jgi:hypothetical protein